MIQEKIKLASENGDLLSSTQKNLFEILELNPCPEWILDSLSELVEEERWEELNDRFHSSLAFGTGGMRGRTIGKRITQAEKGEAKEKETPRYAAVGSNTLNELTVLRATKALYLYVCKWMQKQGIFEQPRLIVAHDVRHFSSAFCQLTARAWVKLGGYAMVFDGPRSTPQLSFAVRYRYAHAGVVITASHNPYHDNGFKAYFSDGAQLVPPHDLGVVDEYAKVELSELASWLVDDALSKVEVATLATMDDMAYKGALEDAVLNPELLKKNPVKLVFTPIHGTGAISSVPALWDHGVQVVLVDEQMNSDPNFGTVRSPNPENADAFELSIKTASKTKTNYILGSDPDCDRIGVVVRNEKGSFTCLSGNQVACMLAEYRMLTLKQNQFLREGNEKGFVLLKSQVTSQMLARIAESFGARIVNTPTGFKWMARKIAKYEEIARTRMLEKEGVGLDFDSTELFTRIEILSRYSACSVLCAEESYGYLPLDLVRDKDGNASALAIAETFAYLESLGSDPLKFLDTLYLKYGFHFEKNENLYFEGAEGSETIKKLMNSYRSAPASSICGHAVVESKDFLEDGLVDEDGDPLPRQNFIQLLLENQYLVAIRPSGTEPKIKYYLFGRQEATGATLSEVKSRVISEIEDIGKWISKDAYERVGGSAE